jgi:hypothetical protein
MFLQTCFWTVFALSRKSFRFAVTSAHDLLCTQSFVVQIARAISTTTSIQSHARLCSPVIGQSFKPPAGLPHPNSPPKCSADTKLFKSIEPFPRLTVAPRHQCVGEGFAPCTPYHAGEATFQRQNSLYTYRESRYMGRRGMPHEPRIGTIIG